MPIFLKSMTQKGMRSSLPCLGARCHSGTVLRRDGWPSEPVVDVPRSTNGPEDAWRRDGRPRSWRNPSCLLCVR